MEDKEDDMFKKLKENVLTKKVETPRQKVIPLKQTVKQTSVVFTAWIEKDLMRTCRLHQVDTGISIKDQINIALNQYHSNK